MKRLHMLWILIVLGILAIGAIESAFADATVAWDFGKYNLKIFIPVTQLDVSYLWDAVGKRNLVGGETPLASIWNIQLTAGGVTSTEGKGAPYVGANLALPNPVPQYAALSAVHPGAFGGRDFTNSSWIGGLKFSLNVF